MAGDRDPVEVHSDDSRDLYDVTEWETRTPLDRLASSLHGALRWGARAFVIVAALVILLVQLVLGGLGAIADPVIGAFVLLSVVPALAIAGYVWYADVTTSEPLFLLVVTFALGVLLAGFAGILNTFVGEPVRAVASGFGLLPIAGTVVFYYLVVGPVEETVKLLAVRLHAFRDDRFDAVVDGAVYGAVAGLGFATIENAIYIAQSVGEAGGAATLQAAGGSAILRSLAGPGHVLYSAFAGYYLGLAKFNPEDAGPIVVKGLLVAAFVHATYNTLVGIVPAVLGDMWGVGPLIGFFAFVIVYDGLFGLVILRKLGRYREAYRRADAGEADYEPDPTESDPTEFDA